MENSNKSEGTEGCLVFIGIMFVGAVMTLVLSIATGGLYPGSINEDSSLVTSVFITFWVFIAALVYYWAKKQ